MFQINHHQVETFERAAASDVANSLIEHCACFAPGLCGMMSAEELRAMVRHGISAANGYGFTRLGTVRFFIDMRTVFGSGFDTDPQYPWVAASLLRCSKDREGAISDQLHTEAIECLRATGRLNDTDMSPLERICLSLACLERATIRNESLVDDLCRVIGSVNPDKVRYHGMASMENLVAKYIQALRQVHFASSVAVSSIMIVSMVELGHCFLTDPLYAWLVASTGLPLRFDAANFKRVIQRSIDRLR